MQIPPARENVQPGKYSLRICGLCELLSHYRAVFSLKNRSNRLQLVAGTLHPVRCDHCGQWFLVQETEAPESLSP